MTNVGGPLSPNEYVLRRISAFEVDPASPDPFHYKLFNPKKDDTDGLSLYRESVKSAEQVADGPGKYGYYVSRFQVQELIDIGFNPIDTSYLEPGHVSLPELSYNNVKIHEAECMQLMHKLAKLAWQRRVLGPTPPKR